MSHLNEMATSMTDKEMLIQALCKHMKLNRRDIEVHDRAQRINGYHAEDNFHGHIIIRKGKSGIPSDIGWELKNGQYVGHVDSYDYTNWSRPDCGKIRLDAAWGQGLQQTYNHEVIKQGLIKKGYKFMESFDKEGNPVITYKHIQKSSGITL